MSFKEKSAFCSHCNRQVLVRKRTPNHVLHFLLGFITLFLWWLIWGLVSVKKAGDDWLCTVCGSPALSKNAYQSDILHGRSDDSGAFGKSSSGSNSKLKVAACVVFGLCLLSAIGNLMKRVQPQPLAARTTESALPSTTSTPTSADDPGLRERVANGERIHKRYNAKYNVEARPIIGGLGTNIFISLPASEWRKLSKREQADVALYAESLVARARTNPHPYIKIDPTAPVYSTIVEGSARMCSTCWSVNVGRVTKTSGGKPTISGDDEPVRGSTALAFRRAASG